MCKWYFNIVVKPQRLPTHTLVLSLLSLSNPPFFTHASRNCDGNASVTSNYKATISLTQQIKTMTRWRPAVREWYNKIWQWKHTTQATNKLTMTISITCKNSPMRGHELAGHSVNSLHKNHVLAKQNCSSRQWCCVATSNRHTHCLSLFVPCYKCFKALGQLWFLAKIKRAK